MAPRQGYKGRGRPARGKSARSAPKNESLTPPYEISLSRPLQSPTTATVEGPAALPPALIARPVTRAQAKKLIVEAKAPQERPRRDSPSAIIPAIASGKSQIQKDWLANCYPDAHSKTQQRQYVPGPKLSKENLKKLQKQLGSASSDMAPVRPTTGGNRGGKRGGDGGGNRGGERCGKGKAVLTRDTSTKSSPSQDSTTVKTATTTSTAVARYRFEILRKVKVIISTRPLPPDIQSQVESIFNREISNEKATRVLHCVKIMSSAFEHMIEYNGREDDYVEPLIQALDLYEEGEVIFATARKSDFHSTLKPQLPRPGQDSGVKTPRPDCIVGFRTVTIDDMLSKRKKDLVPLTDLLEALQAENVLYADPTSNGAGVLFPALVIEGKAYSTGQSIFEAENQAAVAASCMINLLRQLTDVHDRYAPDSPRPNTVPFVFSIATQGPQFHLFVHYPLVERKLTSYQARMLGSWNALVPGHAEQFLLASSQLIGWMKDEFLKRIVDQLVVVAENRPDV